MTVVIEELCHAKSLLPTCVWGCRFAANV